MIVLYIYARCKRGMKDSITISLNKRLAGYLLLVILCVYFGSITFFPHTHIVDGVTIVHSHPYKSKSGNIPSDHGHTKDGFVLIRFLSCFMATAALSLTGKEIIRVAFKNPVVIPVESHNPVYYLYSVHRPRAPALILHNQIF